VLKEVSHENQHKVNKLIQIHCLKFVKSGEQISMSTSQKIYEDRFMSVKRAA
jgi:hypothetical protein